MPVWVVVKPDHDGIDRVSTVEEGPEDPWGDGWRDEPNCPVYYFEVDMGSGFTQTTYRDDDECEWFGPIPAIGTRVYVSSDMGLAATAPIDSAIMLSRVLTALSQSIEAL